MLEWTQSELAEVAGVTQRAVVDFERDVGLRAAADVTAIRTALEAAGVEFIAENGGGAGVRLRKATEER
ncbi:XRE family transcriptional regulator [Belnapia sp. T18]|uniref:XRE family transcriptional regulator n=2 Tax=Belnapia arida TaxID=2804533 RepID=A0ABS1UD28_9PROT|nr:XRE family transcriptional regulator [Belnapia arida]